MDESRILAETRLLFAAHEHDGDKIRHFVSGGVNVNCKLADSATVEGYPSHTALAAWWKRVANPRVCPGATPLHAVCSNSGCCGDEAPILRQLLELGACVDVVNVHGDTPLHVACRLGLAAQSIGILVEACSKSTTVLKNVDGQSPVAVALRFDGRTDSAGRRVEVPTAQGVLRTLCALFASGRLDPATVDVAADFAPVWVRSDDPALILDTLLKCGARCDVSAALKRAQSDFEAAIDRATADGGGTAQDFARRRDSLVRLLESPPDAARFWPWIGMPSGTWDRKEHASMISAQVGVIKARCLDRRIC